MYLSQPEKFLFFLLVFFKWKLLQEKNFILGAKSGRLFHIVHVPLKTHYFLHPLVKLENLTSFGSVAFTGIPLCIRITLYHGGEGWKSKGEVISLSKAYNGMIGSCFTQ